MYFRNTMDKYHYFGSMGLSFVLMFFFAWMFEKLAPGNSGWQYFVLGYICGFVAANILGLIMEAMEAWLFIHHSDARYWQTKPAWMKKYISGDDWDNQDITLNFLGASIIHPVLMLIKDFARGKK